MKLDNAAGVSPKDARRLALEELRQSLLIRGLPEREPMAQRSMMSDEEQIASPEAGLSEDEFLPYPGAYGQVDAIPMLGALTPAQRAAKAAKKAAKNTSATVGDTLNMSEHELDAEYDRLQQVFREQDKAFKRANKVARQNMQVTPQEERQRILKALQEKSAALRDAEINAEIQARRAEREARAFRTKSGKPAFVDNALLAPGGFAESTAGFSAKDHLEAAYQAARASKLPGASMNMGNIANMYFQAAKSMVDETELRRLMDLVRQEYKQ